MKPICYLVPLATVLALGVIASLAETRFAPGLSGSKHLSVTREVLLNSTIHPNAIVRAYDNGFLIAGDGGAIRIDAIGRVKWNYMPSIGAISPSGNDIPRYLKRSFTSAVVLSDDSVFLCGYVSPMNPHAPTLGLLTHLDKTGTIISEQLLTPRNERGPSFSHFFDCVSNTGGIIVMGDTRESFRNLDSSVIAADPYVNVYSYWILSLDDIGQVRWERLIPSQLRGTSTMAFAHITLNGELIYVAPRAEGTEVIRLNAQGELLAQRVVSNMQFIIAEALGQDNALKLITSTAPVTLITLNDDLYETGRIVALYEPAALHAAYRLPDQSLMLFGSKETPVSSFAQVVRLNSSLREPDTIDLETTANSSLWVDAAVPTNKRGQFASVRMSLSRGGLVLDFVDDN